jgi:hypothetical protein
MDDSSALRLEAARVQSSGILGEARVRRLFDYLVASSLAGQAPKEIAIAIDVFGKDAAFDVSQDALVRVYIHKLRKALGDFYAAREGEAGPALLIPRGEYRLQFTGSAPPPGPPPPSAPAARRFGLGRIAAAFLSAAVLLGLVVAWSSRPHSDLDRTRASPVWSSILKDDRPILIVFGDYYLIGETDSSMNVTRLIREYSVNSKSDLEKYVEQHPEVADSYMDVGLRYLPIASAFALRNVMAVLAPENRRIVITKMSDVEPSSIKSADIVYIGYLSGLGLMQDVVFRGSRFAVGESYDEILDQKTKHLYISQTGSQTLGSPQPSGKETYHDYGLFAKFRGPGGNSIILISGTRDEGVQQTAEAFTSSEKLGEFGRQFDTALPFEALLEVSAFDGVNLSGKLVLESKRDGTVTSQ